MATGGAMRILITNDDGIYSPGIAALAEVASRFGEVRIVAPNVEMSSAAHSITASRPLEYKRARIKFGGGIDAYAVNGTPADCVALGAHQWDGVDLVLSGVNLGSNLGNAIWHSGTLAGAKQGALLGFLVPAKELKLVNVNLPAREPRGVLWTRQSVRHYDGRVVPGKDPNGRTHWWFTVVPVEQVEEGTDRWAIERGYVSMTPLRLDLTDEDLLARVQAHLPADRLSFV
jgi:5'/3'-nucleotidase